MRPSPCSSAHPSSTAPLVSCAGCGYRENFEEWRRAAISIACASCGGNLELEVGGMRVTLERFTALCAELAAFFSWPG